MKDVVLILLSLGACGVAAFFAQRYHHAKDQLERRVRASEPAHHMVSSANSELKSPENHTTSPTHHMVSEERAHVESEASRYYQGLVQKAESDATRIVLECMERTAAATVAESTTLSISLPSDEMKGRLIGREGRNIKAFEQAAEVDLIIDHSPDSVLISSFDPIRREVARIALAELLKDGRIHPARIEEAIQSAQKSISAVVRQAGRDAAAKAGVTGLPGMVLDQMGELRFRASLGQNLLGHSVETAQIAAQIATELGLNVQVARTAGFLHDIGKGLVGERPVPHAHLGREFLSQFGMHETILNAVAAHHREIEPESPEAVAVIVADSISASRPGARSESYEAYLKRITTMEEIACAIPGVDRAYAVQSGRDLRVFVKPNAADDKGTKRIGEQILARIQEELPMLPSIKITMIREFRVEVRS